MLSFHAPQWIALIWLAGNLIGVTVSRKHSRSVLVSNAITTVIWVALLYWGGFWS